MKKILLSCCLLLTASTLFAQPDFPENPNDTVINQVDFRNTVLGTTQQIIDTCPVVPLPQISVVRFQTYANAYIPKLAAYVNKPLRVYRNGALINQTQMQQNQSMYLQNLQLGAAYLIKTQNRCGQWIDVASFNTIQTAPDPDRHVVVSEKLNSILSASVETNGADAESLMTTIAASGSIPYYERLAFIQEYFMDGIAFENTKDIIPQLGGIAIEFTVVRDHFLSKQRLIDLLEQLRKDCNCKILVANGVGPIEDGWIDYGISDVYPSYPSGTDAVIKHVTSSKYDEWSSYSRQGAARYEQIWQEAKRAGNRTATINRLSDTDPTGLGYPSYRSRIEYNLLCTTKSGYQVSCNCEKDLDIGYSYMSEVKTNIREPKGSSSAQAVAKDFAILVIDNGIAAPITEAKLIAMAQSYKQTIDYTKIMNGVKDIIKGAVKTTRWGNKQTEAGVTMILDGVTGIVDGAKNVKKAEGYLGTESNSATLLDGIKRVRLKPNTPVMVTLYSASSLEMKGERTWKSEVSSVSSYYLGTYIACGMPEGTIGSCYKKGAASWMTASVVSESARNNFKNLARTFFYIRGWDGFDNKAIGSRGSLCVGSGRFAEQISIETSSVAPYKYVVTNMAGQIIEKGSYNESKFDEINFNKQFNAVPGIYIIRLIDSNNTMQTIKFYHN